MSLSLISKNESMKISYCIIAVMLNLSLLSCKGQTTGNEAKGFAVVELFSSEGCSSCPPADKAVADLLKHNDKNVYVLGYHVDYWNNLGWKDKFSDAAYSAIQKKYAQHFNLASLYTPQVVVNGSEQFVGSDVKKLEAAVNDGLQHLSSVHLSITTQQVNNNINVQYATDADSGIVHIALVQAEAEDKIGSGENNGAILHHVNIVRDIKTTVASKTGNVTLKLPDNFASENFKVIAFVQGVNDDKIIAATATGIN